MVTAAINGHRTEHPVRLRAAGGRRSEGPVVLQRTEEDFVGALLDELQDANGFASAMASAVPFSSGATPALFQPVHRIFHLVLVEAVCDTVGTPRLDPQRIESAGLVLRRHPVDERGNVMLDRLEAWVQDASTPTSRAGGATKRRTIRGWTQLGGRLTGTLAELDVDPDPTRRPPELRAGHEEIERRLALTSAAAAKLGMAARAERIAPLFVAPPDVCKATGKTLLYGLVPVTSAELGSSPAQLPPFDATELSTHLPRFLRAGGARPVPRPGQIVRYSNAGSEDLAEIVGHLRQLAMEFGAFEATPEAVALVRALNAIQLPVADPSVWPPDRLGEVKAAFDLARGFNQPMPGLTVRGAGDWMRDAANVLVAGDDRAASPPASLRMPLEWPAISAETAASVLSAVATAMQARLTTIAPREGRYTDPSRRYRLRAFIRVRGHEDGACPPRLVWSDHSAPFTIAPWYAPSDTPPVPVPLPDARDRALLKALKPNVAFVVPKSLQDVLNGNDPKKMVKGEGGDGTGNIALDWICGFNIPIITLCAFIVLNIFLSLFDIIFQWMMWAKICVPIPKRK